MAWITPSDVSDVYPDATVTTAQLAHIQGLAEGCIGAQTEPVSNAIKAVMVDVAWRFWRGVQASATNPEGYQAERTPEYGYEHPAGGPILSGFGLTDKECRALKKAAGVSGLSTIRVSRGAVETPSRTNQFQDPEFDVV